MNKLYYEAFSSNRRKDLVMECAKYIKDGLKAFYILPSREAMFDARRLFTEELGGIFGCNVVGFDDFERLILGKSLFEDKIIGDMEARIVLTRVLKDIPSVFFFDKVTEKPGFLDLLLHTIRQLKRCNISPDEFLLRTAELKGDSLKKCESLHFIYSTYERIKSEKDLMDIDDISMKAVEACGNTKIFEKSGILVIDGFINIDPVNTKLIKNIIEEHPEISVYANMPFKNKNNEQFLLEEVIRDFKQLGFEGVETEALENTIINNSLQIISNNLYSGDMNIKVSPENLKIYNSPCMDHEIRIAAGKAKELIQNSGINPSDIAVITSDRENYKSRVIQVFKEYGVPLNLKQQSKLSSIPMIKDIMALWRLGLQGEYQTAFISLVTSKYLLPIDILSHQGFETDKLLNIAEGILKKDEQSEFFKSFLSKYTASTEDELLKEAMRNFINSVLTFEKALQEKPLGIIKAFKEFIKTRRINGNISGLYREGILSEELWLRDMESMIELLKLFDQMVRVYEEYSFDSTDITLEAFIRELFALITGIETGDISRDSSGVRFIPPDLARGQTYDTVFLLGINEGIFPSGGNASKLFDNYETQQLFSFEINLGSSEWELEREKLRFNACLAAANNRLYLSYRTADEDGSIMIASPFIDEVISVLDKESKEIAVEKPVSMRDRVSFKGESWSINEAVKKTNSQLRNNIVFNKSSISGEVGNRLMFPAHAATIEFSREVGNEFDAYDGKLEQPVLAQQDASYGFSVSQLNKYAWCPFMYFAERVLDLTIEDEGLQELFDTGSFYHEVLKEYYEENKNPMEPNLDRLKKIFEKLVKTLTLASIPIPLKKYMIEKLSMLLRNFIIYDSENMLRFYEMTGCTLKPVMLEEPFKMKFGNENSALNGVADRIDLEVDSKGSYTGRFIIYDYKKGKIKGVKDCIEGSDFQLPLYNSAFKNILKEKFNISEPECLALLYYSIEKLDRNGIIRKDIKKVLFEGRKGTTSTPAKANMEIVLSWAQKEALVVIESIRKGRFMLPRQCPASSMFPCSLNGMCRYDRTRLAMKEGEI